MLIFKLTLVKKRRSSSVSLPGFPVQIFVNQDAFIGETKVSLKLKLEPKKKKKTCQWGQKIILFLTQFLIFSCFKQDSSLECLDSCALKIRVRTSCIFINEHKPE